MWYHYRCFRTKWRHLHQYFPLVLQSIYKFFKMCALYAMINALVTKIHTMRVLLDGRKWIVSRSVWLNGEDILNVTRAFGSKGFVIENRLILLLSIYIIISPSYNFNPTGKPDQDHCDNYDKNNYLINEVLEKLNWTLSIRIIKNKETFL